ncbi:Pre-C2HC domain [Cinara cedri]|uniref:Pre-C2HC domain n=1 Tax=Cinara cedri TaxID=506608 RepID=A0A5E4MRM7_9HEMI|nr:Pre-C2HC domain [Cinara cedri]
MSLSPNNQRNINNITLNAVNPNSPGDNIVNIDESLNGEWTYMPNKKNVSDSSDPCSPDPNKIKYKKLFITENRYDILQAESQITQNSTTDTQNSTSETPYDANPIKPQPPIFVKGIANFPDLCAALIEKIGVDNIFCKSSANSLKIQTTNPDAYRTRVHFLRDQKAQFHTYQLREDKPTRVVLRNLHPTTSIKLIKSELELRLFEVRKVTNVLHKTSKSLLPLFFVDLEPTAHSNDIFELSSFLHTKIKVEESYKPKALSQCLNCHDYGHTRAYCGYPSRCVRCSAFHRSFECTKTRDTAVKCALCSGDHPANYRGYNVYKELQRRKSSPTKSNFLYDNIKDNVNNHNVKATHYQTHLELIQMPLLKLMLKPLLVNHHSPLLQPPLSTDLTVTMSSFVHELKSLISPLIALLTQVIASLLNKKNE